MDESAKANVPLAVQVGFIGSSSMYDDLAGPFLAELEPALEEAGFRNTDAEYIRENFNSSITTLYQPSRGRPYNDVFGAGIFILVVVFIGSAVGQWAIGKLCDELYTSARRCLGDLAKRLRTSDRVVHVAYDCWFDSSEVLVRVVCTLRAGEPDDVVDALVPVAIRRAAAWVEAHAVTRRMVEYRIEHGRLADNPKVGELREWSIVAELWIPLDFTGCELVP